jgi:DNA-binding PadR family transcriptional regulator
MKDDATTFLPLSPATLHILLSLAGDDLHGYGIMQEVARQSEGKYKLGPGTLYDNLQKLIRHKLVQELGRRAGDDDPRRRYYRLTSAGRGVLAAETARLAGVVREARLRLQIAKLPLARPRRA